MSPREVAGRGAACAFGPQVRRPGAEATARATANLKGRLTMGEGSCACGSPLHARGMCKRCYSRWRQAHDPTGKVAAYNAKRRVKLPPRTCPVCGEPNERGAQALYCSVRCKKRVENAGRNGWKPSSRPMPAPYDCEECGRSCVPGENVAPHGTKFCGSKCKAKWHRPPPRHPPPLGPTCRVSDAPGPRTWIEGPCPECGERFVSLAGPRKVGYCSRRCQRRVINRRRRGWTAGAGHKPLHFRVIAERDGWLCQLCGDPVERDAAVPEPLAPTVDHIIPLSCGGAHDEMNVQLAHFICNSRKADGRAVPIGGQCALV